MADENGRTIDLESKSVEELKNLISNYEAGDATASPIYAAAQLELSSRRSPGLDIRKTESLIVQAIKEGRYVSYKDVAKVNGFENFSKVRFQIRDHLEAILQGNLIAREPILTVFVVEEDHKVDGWLPDHIVTGIVTPIEASGRSVADGRKFIEEQRDLLHTKYGVADQ